MVSLQGNATSPGLFNVNLTVYQLVFIVFCMNTNPKLTVVLLLLYHHFGYMETVSIPILGFFIWDC